MSGTIVNAANIPLNVRQGTVPDVSGALKDYFQNMVFVPTQKTVSGFQLVENADPISFWGTIQPFSPRQLMIKPEGLRKWQWFTVHAEPGVVLTPNEVFTYLGTQYRIMSSTNYAIYGYVMYELIQDYIGSGP